MSFVLIKKKSFTEASNPEEGNSDSEKDEEGEFIPSSWDSLALPSRSALKSPDRILDQEIVCISLFSSL